MAASLATMAGWRKSLASTIVPTRRVVVATAAAVRAGIGANWSRRWSAQVRVEYPRPSTFRASSAHSRAVAGPDA